MTVDELWEDVNGSLEKTPLPARVRESVSGLLATPEGRRRLCQGLEKKLPGKMALLKLLAAGLDPAADVAGNVPARERQELLGAAAKAARGRWKEDATYWALLWLRIKGGESQAAAEAAKDLRAFAA